MTRRSTAIFVAMVCLVISFAVWGIAQAVAVQALREDLSHRVNQVTGIQPALPILSALPDEPARWQALRPELEATLDDIDASVPAVNTAPARAAIRAVELESGAGSAVAVEVLAALQGDLRSDLREISEQLSRYWSVVNVLLAAALLASVVALGQLFVLLRRQQALSETHTALSRESRRRKVYAESLEASEQALAVILESIDEGIITVDEGGRITRLNAAAEGLTGSQRRSVIGAPLAGVVQLRVRRSTLALDVAQLRGGLVLYPDDDARLYRGDGTRCTVAVRTAPLGGRPGALMLLRDTTDEKVIAEERLKSAKLATTSRLVAGVSHELNNPLTILKGALERLPGSPEALTEAHQALARMVVTLRQIGALSQVTPRSLEALEVGPVVVGVVDILRPRLRPRARLHLQVASSRLVFADRARLEQALLGLLVGATQPLPDERESALTVTVTPEPGQVVIGVVDSAARVEKSAEGVGDPFLSARTIGESMGLAYARAEVSALGGSVSTSSLPGGGRAVRMVLPLAEESDSVVPVKGLRVLVIDDEVSILSVIRRMLRGRFEVVSTSSAKEGLSLLLAGEYDVALCDLMMPIMTGMQLYATLAEARPDLANRMAFMTGGAFDDRARDFLNTHQSVSLTKPFSPDELLAVLTRAVSQSEAG